MSRRVKRAEAPTPVGGGQPGSAAPAVPEQAPVEQPVPVEQSLGRRATRGAMLTLGGQGLRIILQVAGVVILSRLLTPDDYGLLAMVMTVIGVAEIFRDFGLSSAAIQATTLSRAQRDNLWWINTAIGAGLTGVVLACAPLIAMLYGRPELTDIARALSVVFLVNGMTTQYRADLTRRLRFRALAICDVIAPLVALGVATGLAWYGIGVWALVAHQLSTAAVLLISSSIAARWLVGRPRRREPMRRLMRFGWHLAGSQLLGYVGNNVDSLVVGVRFGTSALGLYNRAFHLLMTPLGQLRAPTTTVALPILSRLKEDRAETNRFVQRGQMALGLSLVAGLALVFGAAEPITAIFLGSQWLSVEPILRLLAVAGVFQTLAYVGYWTYLAHGLTRELLQYTVISVVIRVTCILVGSTWGVLGVAAGYALAPGLAWPLSFWWLSRSSGIAVRPLFAGAGHIIGLAVAVGAATWGTATLTDEFGSWWQLGAAVAAAVFAYALTGAVVPLLRREIVFLTGAFRRGLRRPGGRG